MSKRPPCRADPQSASMAKAIDADQNLIAAISHAFFRHQHRARERGRVWLILGHGAAHRRREENELATSKAMVPIDHPGAVALQVIDDKPAEIVERFFLEVVRPRFNGRVLSLAIVGLPNMVRAMFATAWCRMPSLAGCRAGGRIGLAATCGVWMPNRPSLRRTGADVRAQGADRSRHHRQRRILTEAPSLIFFRYLNA